MDTSKIIRGVVSNGRYTVTAPIVKEDYGLYLQIEGVELPPTYQVDFSNSENSGTSVTMIGNSDGVLIPHQFISTGKDVFAFLYHVGEDYGRTVYKFRIPNKVRPDRTEDTPTPEEQSVIDQAISALNEAVEQTSADVASADQSARSAQGYAEQAETAKDTAQGYASNAQLSATQASNSAISANQSASASAQSASQSAQIKADVEDLVDDAQGYARASAQSASASANSATTAQGYANSASASAQSASGYASQAQLSAQTASTKASEASQSANMASQKATEASQSASQALTYKTDAESAKTASQTAQGLAESARDSAISAKDDAESARDDAESARDEAQQAVESISGALADKADIITDTASGAIASFSDGTDDLPLKSLVVDINPIQDLSNGDPSPENICPISGWSGVNVQRTGKNLLPFPYAAETTTRFGITYTVHDDGTVTVNGTATQDSWFELANTWQYDVKVLGDKTIYVSGCPSGGSDGTYKLVCVPTGHKDIGNGFTISDFKARWFRFQIQVKNGTTVNNLVFKPMVVLGSTATLYEPYTGRSITINLGQTVYGGTLDVISGVLTVDRAMLTVTECSSVSTASTGVLYASVSVATGATAKAEAPLNKNISSVYKYRVNAPTDGGWFRAFINTIFIFDNRFTDKATADTILSTEQPVFVYELATPITIQLTPNQVNSLLGVNNIWADSGDTEVEYRADTKAYIAKKIAEALASLT